MELLRSLEFALMNLMYGWRYVQPGERALLAVTAAGVCVWIAIRDTERHDAMPIIFGLSALLMLGYAANIVVAFMG